MDRLKWLLLDYITTMLLWVVSLCLFVFCKPLVWWEWSQTTWDAVCLAPLPLWGILVGSWRVGAHVEVYCTGFATWCVQRIDKLLGYTPPVEHPQCRKE